MRKVLFALVVFSLLIAGCQPAPAAAPVSDPASGASSSLGEKVTVDGGAYTDIDPAGLFTMLDDKNFAFVNVHIPFEGEIANTDVSIPFNEISQHLDQLPAKDARIVLYCRSGRMSAIAAEELVKLGYTDVWNLKGGFNAWEAAGLPMDK
jgi:rhodanese-related sulfurtransferase